ncbi:hypothetical protein AVEN_170276-1 [Araneus ventricosus]|uniref:Uncharacterized protein n=1 Tax=Araneus ventricosus TaxID=182803 RepID=A0A4Y2TI54_ARAVE|nr:hypothetical protein AVEN_170276-1 [Araneus ventricosus]
MQWTTAYQYTGNNWHSHYHAADCTISFNDRATSSTEEERICFRPQRNNAKLPSCFLNSVSSFIGAHGYIAPLHICFIRHNSFYSSTEFCWFRQKIYQ